MSDQIKYVFIVTGRNDPHKPTDTPDPMQFTVMAAQHVLADILRYNRIKGTSTSPFTGSTTVRFLRYAFYDPSAPGFNINDVKTQTGSISSFDHSFPSVGAIPAPGISKITWTPVNDLTNFPMSTLISIVDMYHAVRNVGKTSPGSVLSINFYSHGFVQGPVLANTSDVTQNNPFTPSNLPRRTTADRDGRARTDFQSNMGEDPTQGNANALAEFQAGLADGATIRCFGCDATEVLNIPLPNDPNPEEIIIRSTAFQVIHAAYVVPRLFASGLGSATKYGNDANLIADLTSSGKVIRAKGKPTLMLVPMQREFTVEVEEAPTLEIDEFPVDQLRVLHYSTDKTAADPIGFFGSDIDFTLIRAFTDVVKYAARQVLTTYIYAAASSLTNVTCFGALPGIGADFDKHGGEDVRMAINLKTYGSRLNFYSTYLEIDHKDPGVPKQRNYARLDGATVVKINNHLNSG